jgi:hypothetical protein
MTAPPRLFVLTATESSMAVVLRRGPSGQVATIGWDRATGAFETGQWLRGKIFEHRSDLSPDGRHMVYLAGTGNPASPSGGWWTAVSRAPWLKAIVFLPQGDTWGGGGAFAAPGRVWLNGLAPSGVDWPRDLAPDPDPLAFPPSTDGFHMGATVVAKMVRRGWEHVGGERYDAVLEKPLGLDVALRLSFETQARNRAIISNRYALVDRSSGAAEDRPDWEWAETWGGHLQHATRGAIFAAPLDALGVPGAATEVQDFTGMKFEPIAAPYEGAGSP